MAVLRNNKEGFLGFPCEEGYPPMATRYDTAFFRSPAAVRDIVGSIEVIFG
jgi:hypothetical protein